MSAHPNALGLLDRAKRLIDESNPPDHSPLTTASRDIREARAVLAELISMAEEAEQALRAIVTAPANHRWAHYIDYADDLRAALARVGGA